jgi:hypothetical protein
MDPPSDKRNFYFKKAYPNCGRAGCILYWKGSNARIGGCGWDASSHNQGTSNTAAPPLHVPSKTTALGWTFSLKVVIEKELWSRPVSTSGTSFLRSEIGVQDDNQKVTSKSADASDIVHCCATRERNRGKVWESTPITVREMKKSYCHAVQYHHTTESAQRLRYEALLRIAI